MSIFARVAMCFLVITLAFATGGCAFGDRHAKYSYTPVMLVKADKPCAVSVATLACQGKTGEQAQIGQLRNVYQIPTAKVLCAQGDPMIWTSDALAAELQHAGFTVQRVSETATPTPGQVCIRGVVKEFFADMTTQVVMKVRRRSWGVTSTSLESFSSPASQILAHILARPTRGCFPLNPGHTKVLSLLIERRWRTARRWELRGSTLVPDWSELLCSSNRMVLRSRSTSTQRSPRASLLRRPERARNRTQSATASSSFLAAIWATMAASRRKYSLAERILCLGFSVVFSTWPQGFDP